MYSFTVSLLQPFPLLMIGLVVATILLWRQPRTGRRRMILLSVCVGAAWILATPPVGYLAIWSLERPYPPLGGFPGGVDAIVVLSGSVRAYDGTGEEVELGADTLFRCLHAVEIHERAGAGPMIVTGGRVDSHRPGPALAEVMRERLIDLGVRPEDILTETESHGTYENALFCRPIFIEHDIDRIVLVTDAKHIARAARTFRAQGVEVVPAPCNHAATWFRFTASSLLPNPNAAASVAAAVHEWLGIVWYWVSGRL